jgi:nicotinate phosphoribosyltransferase
MSVVNRQRLPSDVFRLDADRMRRGWYSDKYFINIADMLTELAAEGYGYRGPGASWLGLSEASEVAVGDLEVEMQIFHRRQPFAVVAGVDEAIAILRECTGSFDAAGDFVNTFDRLMVEAVHDGTLVPYDGDPTHVRPVLRIRGRYRDFAILETPILGALAEASRVATNVFGVLTAARGKDILFFPARFAHYKLQALHGYAYSVAVAAYNRQNGKASRMLVSTDEQAAWWGGNAAGTVAHAAIACFLGDTPETMMQFARLRPPGLPRIALVDFHNDCVGDTLRVMDRLFAHYRALVEAGDLAEAERYRLFAIRPDASASLRDASIEPLGDPALDCGVNPRLIHTLRAAIDAAYTRWDLPPQWVARARDWCQSIKIVATGGFTPERIARFEQLGVPADIYGVGSYLLTKSAHDGTSTDFTADIVRVNVRGEWRVMAKVGRFPGENEQLQPVGLDE